MFSSSLHHVFVFSKRSPKLFLCQADRPFTTCVCVMYVELRATAGARPTGSIRAARSDRRSSGGRCEDCRRREESVGNPGLAGLIERRPNSGF